MLTHHKEIKRIIRKELKRNFPDRNRPTKKEKKSIAKKAPEEAVASYDFSQPVGAPLPDLLGIGGRHPSSGIIRTDEMPDFIENHRSGRLFGLKKRQHDLYRRSENNGLKIIDNIPDNQVPEALLSYEGYTPAARKFFLSQLLRAELLKVLKYPAVPYRQYCSKEYMGQERRISRIFIGLPLNTGEIISHNLLCQFRASLSFTQTVNITACILYHFMNTGLLKGERTVYCTDSTELTADNQELPAVLNVKGRNIRVYDDPDCDCGKRRKKRDKSVYSVGYRLHTLTAVNAETGRSYPLISFPAPGNHHDRNFHEPPVEPGKAVGLDIRVITADKAYPGGDGSFYEKTGVHLITPPEQGTVIPENTDAETGHVMCDELCEIPMDYIGTEDGRHEFRCGAAPGSCCREGGCPAYRRIPFDSGRFQMLLHSNEAVKDAVDIRKNAERPFNLLKKREGPDPLRVRSRHGAAARCTSATMVTLLPEIAGTRRKTVSVKKEDRQLPLPCAA